MGEKPPALKFKEAPCILCGARTERQAETRCKPSLGIDDEYTCPGEFNARGYSHVPTPESMKWLDDWYAAENRRIDEDRPTTKGDR